MTDPLDLECDGDEVHDLWEAGFGCKMQIRKEIQNRKMRELVELATTLDELKPVLLMLIARQGSEL